MIQCNVEIFNLERVKDQLVVYLLHLTPGIGMRLHRPELEENVQSEAEHQTEETEGRELGRVAARNTGHALVLQADAHQAVQDDEDVQDDDDRRDLPVVGLEAGGNHELDCDGTDEGDESEGLGDGRVIRDQFLSPLLSLGQLDS